MNNIIELKKINNVKFDFIIKRSIINVLSRSKQLKVINNLGYFLKKKARLSCEFLEMTKKT